MRCLWRQDFLLNSYMRLMNQSIQMSVRTQNGFPSGTGSMMPRRNTAGRRMKVSPENASNIAVTICWRFFKAFPGQWRVELKRRAPMERESVRPILPMR